MTTPSNGQIYVINSNLNIVTASIDNKTITLNCLSYGSTIITVRQNIGIGDYINLTSQLKSILFTNIDSVLNNNSWKCISYISQQGTGSNYW